MGRDVIRVELPASLRYLNLVGACVGALVARIDGLADAQQLSYSLQLAADELFANIVEHAYAGVAHGQIALALAVDDAPRRLVIELRDSGAAFEPSAVAAPDLGWPQERGYGLFLVRQLVDDLAYQRQAGGNLWRLTKHL